MIPRFTALFGRRPVVNRSVERPPYSKIEALEARIAPANLTISISADEDDRDPMKPNDFVGDDGQQSLREAIFQINHDHGGSITFAVPSLSITMGDLPSIDYKVTISGMAGGNGAPGTELSGGGTHGLLLGKGGTVSNLVINGFTSWGLAIDGPGMVSNCYVGTDTSGSSAKANTGQGISVGGSGVTVKDCVVSGNSGDGIGIDGPISGVKVQHNKIGVDVTGLMAIPNQCGVFIGSGAHGNLVGGNTFEQLNVISGNTKDGVIIGESFGDSPKNVISGNYIGVGIDGKTKLANGRDGVYIHCSTGTIIGGTKPGTVNVIAGNGLHGVEIAGSANLPVLKGNIIEKN